MMAVLLLRLAGPLQSWGTTSRFDERDTGLEPSKSGVLGLLCAALGRDRTEAVDDLCVLKMGVRVDREGIPLRDYQTATGVINAEGKVGRERTVVSPRHYLSDAAFLVGLEGDISLLESLQSALKAPVWPLALGRKACVPSLPIWLNDGLRTDSLRDVLIAYPRIATPQHMDRDQPLRLVIEDSREGSVRFDQPTAPFSERSFGPRFIKTEVCNVPLTAHA